METLERENQPEETGRPEFRASPFNVTFELLVAGYFSPPSDRT